MKAACLVVVVLFAIEGAIGCAGPRAVSAPSSVLAPEPEKTLPPVMRPPTPVPIDEIGKDAQVGDWIDLAMPEDARVLSYTHEPPWGRETWTLAEAGGRRRVVRIELESPNGVGQAAYAGETTKDGMELHLVEVVGNMRFAPERLTATCTPETMCDQVKPSRRVRATYCSFASENESVLTWLAPGKGIDGKFFVCPHAPENTRREELLKRPRRDTGF